MALSIKTIMVTRTMKNKRWKNMAEIREYQSKFGVFRLAGKQLEPRLHSGIVGKINFNCHFDMDEMAQIQKKICPSETEKANIKRAIKIALGIVPTDEPKAQKVDSNKNVVDIKAVINHGLMVAKLTELETINKMLTAGIPQDAIEPHISDKIKIALGWMEEPKSDKTDFVIASLFK